MHSSQVNERHPAHSRNVANRATRCQPADRAAFTLNELLVVLAIITIFTTPLLNSVQNARESARYDFTTLLIKSQFCEAMTDFLRYQERLPDDLSELVWSGYGDLESSLQRSPEGEWVAHGYVFELIVDPAEIQEHIQWMRSQGEDGEQFAEHLENIRTEYLIFARTIEPWPTGGCRLIYMGEDCELRGFVDPDCEDLMIGTFHEIAVEGLAVTGRLLSTDPDAAGAVLPLVRQPQTTREVFELFDVNRDGTATISELESFARPPSAGSDDPLSLAFRDFMQFALYDRMQIGPDDGDIGVTLDDLTGDPATMFYSDNYLRLIDRVVEHDGLANSLAVKVLAAESARLRWENADPETRAEEAEACREIVEAFRQELWAHGEDRIAFEDALMLDAAVGVLCPNVEQPQE